MQFTQEDVVKATERIGTRSEQTADEQNDNLIGLIAPFAEVAAKEAAIAIMRNNNSALEILARTMYVLGVEMGIAMCGQLDGLSKEPKE